MGNAGARKVRRGAGHQHPEHVVAALERPAEAGKSLPYAPEPNSVTKKMDVVWFALNDDRPLFVFASIWTEFKGDRGTMYAWTGSFG
jgi:hypothetical protein